MSKQQRWVLTGGIGSGKSAVGQMLRALGAEVIDADVIGHEVLSPGGPAFFEVAAKWSDAVRGGTVDRRTLGSIVFSNAGQLAELEAITHPHIRNEINRRVESSRAMFVFVEASVPRLVSSAGWHILVVDAPREARLERLAERGLPREDALMRMAVQADREGWLEKADQVIDNAGNREELERSVLEFARTIGLRS